MLIGGIPSWIRAGVNAQFIKSVALLSVGNIAGQGIVICSYPFLARLFSPSEFGVLAVYTAIIALLAVVAALRYELAIPLPKAEATAVNLLVLSLTVAAANCVLVAIAVFLFGGWIADVTHITAVRSYLWLIPVGFFAAGCYQVVVNWALRWEKFPEIAKSKITQGVAQAGSQLVLGLLRFGPVGLVLGDLLGQSAADTTLGITTLKAAGPALRGVSLSSVKVVAKRYRRFPLFSSFAAVLNTGSLQLPAILLSALYGPHVAGWFSLSWRAVLIPAAFVGEAVAQVYAGTASRLAQHDRLALSRLFYRLSIGLLTVGILPIGLITLFGPDAFRIIFGSEWRESGVYVQILGAALLAQFCVGSLSRTLTILERQHWQLAWDAGRFVIVVAGLSGAAYLHLPSRLAVIIYSASLLCTYVVFFLMSVVALGSSRQSGSS